MDAIEVLTRLGAPEGRANPYPLYAALHEIGEAVEAGPGEVLVVGYDAINSVLRDPGFRVSDETSFDETTKGTRHVSLVAIQALSERRNRPRALLCQDRQELAVFGR